MRLIHNTNVAFRCPNTLKEALEAYALNNDLHVGAVVRAACSRFLQQEERELDHKRLHSSREWWKVLEEEMEKEQRL